MSTTTTQIKKVEEDVTEYQIMDILDESVIRNNLAGFETKDLVYEFPMAGRTVTGLSAIGVIQVSRLAVDHIPNFIIDVEQPISQERTDSWHCACKATYKNPKMNSSVSFWGTKTQSKNIMRRDGTIAKENDPNAEQIGETKSQRNAIRKVLPPAVEDYFIAFFKKEGKIRKFSANETKEAIEKAKNITPPKTEEKPIEKKPVEKGIPIKSGLEGTFS